MTFRNAGNEELTKRQLKIPAEMPAGLTSNSTQQVLTDVFVVRDVCMSRQAGDGSVGVFVCEGDQHGTESEIAEKRQVCLAGCPVVVPHRAWEWRHMSCHDDVFELPKSGYQLVA